MADKDNKAGSGSWRDYVITIQALGFNKVTIINKDNYQILAKTSDADVATAWKDGDKQVNENQELLDDWSDQKRASFYFYGKKFNIIQRGGSKKDEEKNEDAKKKTQFVVCLKDQEVFIAKQFKTIWVCAYGRIKKDQDDKQAAKGFKDAPDAYKQICEQVFDSMDEAGL